MSDKPDVAALIARLNADADEFDGSDDIHPPLIITRDLLRQAAAALQSLMTDAERYQYGRARVYCREGRFQMMLPESGMLESGRPDLAQRMDAAIDAARAKPNVPYPEFCRHPDKCAGRGTCPRDPCCCD
jgi:hypothetical protein